MHCHLVVTDLHLKNSGNLLVNQAPSVFKACLSWVSLVRDSELRDSLL